MSHGWNLPHALRGSLVRCRKEQRGVVFLNPACTVWQKFWKIIFFCYSIYLLTEVEFKLYHAGGSANQVWTERILVCAWNCSLFCGRQVSNFQVWPFRLVLEPDPVLMWSERNENLISKTLHISQHFNRKGAKEDAEGSVLRASQLSTIPLRNFSTKWFVYNSML